MVSAHISSHVFTKENGQRGNLVQLISVTIVEGAGKYLFGKVFARNYPNEFISFYYRDDNNCELLGEKPISSPSDL